MKNLLLLLIIFGCSKAPVKPVEDDVVIHTFPAEESSTALKTPVFQLPKYASDDLVDAVELIKLHANSDGFYKYFLERVTRISHTALTPKEAVEKFRSDLNKEDSITVVYYRPWYRSAAIGGWNGEVISENSRMVLTPTERASHLLHEASHKYGFWHMGNYQYKNSNEISFPYLIGDLFQEYLEEVVKK